MAVAPRFIVDNSAYNRLKHQVVRERLQPLLAAQLVATCGVMDLEALFSATGLQDYQQLRRQRGAVMTYIGMDEVDVQRALEAQYLSARKSQHRGAKLPDLMLAAVALRHDLTLLHYDSDFDRIAAMTGQRAEGVVRRGSVP